MSTAPSKRALPEWLETTPQERSEMLLKLADVLDEHAEELATLGIRVGTR
jgi:acyl-CoA reductase-like NAD-dependent aldehyde dehydrogenase